MTPDDHLIIQFRSGSNRVPDMLGTMEAGQAVGVVAQGLTPYHLSILASGLNSGIPVFVDSGAFGEWKNGQEPDWDAVIYVYQTLARLAPSGLSRLTVVAPDKVGDQESSLVRLRAHGRAMADLAGRGVDVVVPYQGGDPQVWGAEVGGIVGRFRAGIPSNAAAVPAEIAGLILRQPAVMGLHLLGMSSHNARWERRLETIRTAAGSKASTVVITADANRISALVGEGRPITQGERDLFLESCDEVWDLDPLESLSPAEFFDLMQHAFWGAPGDYHAIWLSLLDEQGRQDVFADLLDRLDRTALESWMRTRYASQAKAVARRRAVRQALKVPTDGVNPLPAVHRLAKAA